MRQSITITEEIKVELLVRHGCSFCDRINQELLQIQQDYPEMILHIKDISEIQETRSHMGGITPTIWVNEELWFLGSFNSDTFCSRMNALKGQPAHNLAV